MNLDVLTLWHFDSEGMYLSILMLEQFLHIYSALRIIRQASRSKLRIPKVVLKIKVTLSSVSLFRNNEKFHGQQGQIH